MSDEVIRGYEQAFRQLGEIRMNDIDEMLTEWHETKSISVATDICEQLWKERGINGQS